MHGFPRQILAPEIVLGHHGGREPEGGRLLEPRREARHRAHLAGQPDLAHDHHVASHGPIEVARGRRDGDAEVGGGLGHARASRHVDEHVLALEREPQPLLEHGQEQTDAIVIGPQHRAARRPEAGRGDEGLHLEQERSGALEARDDDGARGAARALGEEEAGRVRHLGEPELAHLEHADLIGRPEAILDGPQHLKAAVTVAFQL